MEEGEQVEKKDSFAALKFGEFRHYLSMRFFFTFAYQMQAVVISIYIYYITKNVLALGLIGLCEAIPAIVIAMYGGYIADKSEKRKMLLWVFSGVTISSLVIFIVTSHAVSSYLSPTIIVSIIYLMIFFNGVSRAFNGPAMFVVYTQSVPKEVYPNASTWSSTSWQIASILAPAAAGLMYGFCGISITYMVILGLLVISLILVYLLKVHPPIFAPKESIWTSLSEGINFVLNSKMMIWAMSLDLFSVLFGGVVAILPVFANDILLVGPKGLGFMRAADSVGAVVMMLLMARFSPMNRPWRNLLIAVAGFGASILCFAFSRNFYLSLFFLFTLGAFDSISVIIRSTIMQLLTPDRMRGRVSAVNQMFIGSSNEIGGFESGLVAKLMGTIPSVIFGGTMTLAIVTTTWFKTKKLVPMTLNEINTPDVIEEIDNSSAEELSE